MLCLGRARSRIGGVIVMSEGGRDGSLRNKAICRLMVELRGPRSCWTAVGVKKTMLIKL